MVDTKFMKKIFYLSQYTKKTSLSSSVGSATSVDKNNGTNGKFSRKVAFLCIRKCLITGLKAEKQLRNKNHTKDWALQGCAKIMRKL